MMEEKDWKILGWLLWTMGFSMMIYGWYLFSQTATITLFGKTIRIYPYLREGQLLFGLGVCLCFGGSVITLLIKYILKKEKK